MKTQVTRRKYRPDNSKPIQKHPLALVIATVITLSSANPAFAADNAEQQTVSSNNNVMEEVIVTSQFREQSVQDTPLAITAVSAEMMENRNLTSIDEIARQAPSVALQPAAALYGPSIQAYIRGVGQYDFNPAYEPGVGMYVDDVYYPTLTGGQMDLLDLDRVEVLRGPQGTLTGRNSIGGAIKMFTRKPDGEAGGYVEASYGSRDLMSIRGGASFTLTDNLYVRLAGVHKEQEGYVDLIDYGCANPNNPEGIAATQGAGNCTWGKLGGQGYTALRAQVRYEADNWTLDISTDKTEVSQSSAASIIRTTSNENFRCGDDCTYADFRNNSNVSTFGGTPAIATYQSPVQTFDGWGTSVKLSVDINEKLNMKYIAAVREYTTSFDTDDDWSPQANSSGGKNRLEHEFESHEIRFNYDVDENLLLTFGGYYSDQTTLYWTLQDIRYLPGGLALQFVGNDPVVADSQAAFASAIYNLTDKFTITAGIRYTEESKDYTYIRRTLDFSQTAPVVGGLDGLTSSYAGNQMDYRLSVDYALNDNAMIYATFATGFKGGGVSARPFDQVQALNGSFDAETLENYEIGGKFDLLDDTLRINTSLYLYNYSDVQQPLSDCSSLGSLAPCGAWQNAGEAQARGFELEAAWAPIENLNIDVSYSFYDFEWKSLDPRLGSAVGLDDPRIWAPETQWSIGMQYVFELADGSTITPRIDTSYTDERLMNGSGSTPVFVEEYILSNARIAWKNAEQDLTIALSIKNLTNKAYELYVFDSVSNFSGTSLTQIGEPREWSLTMKKTF